MTSGPENPYGPPGPPYQPPYQPPSQPPYQQPPYGGPGYLPSSYAQPAPNEGLAVASMVVGIVSIVLTCLYGIGLLGSPVALVLGRVSMKRIDRSQGQLGGRGMAQAGFILGIIGTVLLILALVAVVTVIIVAVNGGWDDSYSYDNP
jgi:uncharacterized protein DUF4190